MEAGVRRRLHVLRLDADAMLMAGGVLLLATVLAARLPARQAVVLSGIAALVWWTFDGAFDGPTLLHVTRTHGITVADLLPPLCWTVVVAARHLPRHRRTRRAQQPG